MKKSVYETFTDDRLGLWIVLFLTNKTWGWQMMNETKERIEKNVKRYILTKLIEW